MTDYNGPIPITTTDGFWNVGVNRSERGDQNDVEISFSRPAPEGGYAQRLTFDLLPSAAREIGKWLGESADALDGEYPGQANR